MATNTVCHIEISVKDARKAGDFYNALFGWNLNFDMGEDYVFFQPESGPGGGLMKSDDFSIGNSLVFYVEVDDIEAYLKKAEELGGKADTPKTEIPNIGWYGRLADPDGNIIGLFTGN